MSILVIGQERTGTHTLANMLKASGIETKHEDQPTLCFEAYNRVVKERWNYQIVTDKAKGLKGKAEANHRIQFFADVFAKELPEAKFIFLVRDPVRIVTSMIGTMAHWSCRTNLPNWYLQRINQYITESKKEFNLYRIPPDNFHDPLPILHLKSLIRGLKVSLPLLELLGNRLKLIKTGKIHAEGPNLWNWLGLNWDETVAKEASQKHDTMYEAFGKDNIASWASGQVAPYIWQIHDEFHKELKQFPIGRKILNMIYHKSF